MIAGRRVGEALRPLVQRFAYTGSYRRGLKTLGDVDIVVIPKRGVSEAMCNAAFASVCPSDELESEGSGLSVGMVLADKTDLVSINVFYTSHNEWGSSLMYTTGSREYNIMYRGVAKKRGMSVNQYGVWRRGTLIPGSGFSEHAVCRAIGVPWLAPRLRDGSTLFVPNDQRMETSRCPICQHAVRLLSVHIQETHRGWVNDGGRWVLPITQT